MDNDAFILVGQMEDIERIVAEGVWRAMVRGEDELLSPSPSVSESRQI